MWHTKWKTTETGIFMTRSHKVLGHIENLFHHAGKSMFWPFTPDQTMNTDFLSPLHGYK